MPLIDRYLEELGTYLPKNIREDLSREIRSNFEKKLQERRDAEPGGSDEELQVEILRDLGPPHELADSHIPRPRVLFGPRLYPPFIRTLKISIAIFVALAALGVARKFLRTPSFWVLGKSLLSALGSVLTGSLVVLGIAVVVFAILERSAVAEPREGEDWDPRSLPETEDPDKISIASQVSSIGFLVVALIALNFFRDRIGAQVTWNDESGWIPLFSPSHDLQLWLLNLALGLDLLVNFLVLLRWQWSLALRWANFGVNCIYVVWLGRLAAGPTILTADAEWLVQNGWSPQDAAEYQDFITTTLSDIVAWNLKIGFLAACLGLAYSLYKVVRRTIGGS